MVHLLVEGWNESRIFDDASDLTQGKTRGKPLAAVGNGLSGVTQQRSNVDCCHDGRYALARDYFLRVESEGVT
jgi:hypothetical protein